jgi:hypothetical protein
MVAAAASLIASANVGCDFYEISSADALNSIATTFH